MKRANPSFYLALVFIVTVIGFILISKRELHTKGILLNGKTTKWNFGASMSVDLEYEFYYEGKKIIEANAFEPFRGNPDFVNRYFPVMYYPRLGGQSQLLITPSNFKEFNLPFPDSLKWVLPYLK